MGGSLLIFKIVTDDKSELRKNFIEKFVDTKKESYKKHIATLKEYPDGMCYDGYLWDSLKADYTLIERKMEQAITFLESKGKVFVMWDIFSKHRVPLNRIFSSKYPKDTLIEIDSLELSKFISREWREDYRSDEKYLPEDFYIFDNTMNWYVIFTHEGYDNIMNPDLDEEDYIRICFVYETTY
jgi:hypothetical protein